MKNILIATIFLATLVSCGNDFDSSKISYSFGGNVFIVNEGNNLQSNGSLSSYSYDSSKVFNNLFYNANARMLGDIPNSLMIKGDKAYIVVENSGKIEIVNKNSIASQETIKGLISPRFMVPVNDYKAYVSSRYSDSLTIINLSDNTKGGYINLRRTSEAIFPVGSYAYITNWAGGNEIVAVNTITNELTDSINVGKGPESIVADKNGKIWVLCTGGVTNKDYGKLVRIDPASNTVEKTFTFPSIDEYPTCLKIDGTGSTMFFIDNGVRKMSIDANSLPGSTYITQNAGQSFYKIAVNAANGDLLVTDAADNSHNGFVLVYNSDGGFIGKYETGINPGNMTFNLIIKTSSGH